MRGRRGDSVASMEFTSDARWIGHQARVCVAFVLLVEPSVHDVLFVLLIIAVFVVLAVVAKGAEKL
jgi:hypothetical protein